MENQQTIARWAEEIFGPVIDHTDLVRRAQTEMVELIEAIEAKDREEIGRETSDIAILLMRLMELNGLDFIQEVNKKMATNRARKWTRSGDGTGSHI